MPLFEMTGDELVEHKTETFAHLAIKEREGLQRILRDHIRVLGDDLLEGEHYLARLSQHRLAASNSPLAAGRPGRTLVPANWLARTRTPRWVGE